MSFKPSAKRTAPAPAHLTFRVDPPEFKRVMDAAKAAGLSGTEFVRQCVFYALDHMDPKVKLGDEVEPQEDGK